ncbi:Biorientation of chromosomes in cell division protein 1-like 1 [Geodia barretti]|uniref:Biorientation of chromosomes in cell division protein 1-like 1 n=1 Tax=Geodia barretti TaxID=519541 RepID=A0AA35RTG5_GEOBA|nr:Biorientation of chromosomes in cell division protein 1-like 1 [Geodia barretti]
MEAQKQDHTSLPLPTVEAVLDKVKSDGTFDQFRKTCLAAVEAEPSMRAYGEQIEVLSRRYLQDHRHKWSDNITKNEVRAKLKDYIVKMIANPDVGISIPVQNMVENSLEKKGPKVLLPQIVDTMKALQKVAQEDAATTSTPSSTATPTSNAPSATPPEKTGGNPEVVGALDLPLPISIPGLNTGRKETSGGGSEQGVKVGTKKDGTGEQATVKVKPKAKTGASEPTSSTSTTTTNTGGGGKVGKPGAQKNNTQGKVAGSKQKEKEDKSPAEEKVEGREKESTDVENGLAVKEKGKGGTAGSKGKKVVKEEKPKETTAKQTEEKTGARDESAVVAREEAKPETTGRSEVVAKEGQKDPAKKTSAKDESANAGKETKPEMEAKVETEKVKKSDTKVDAEEKAEANEEGREEEGNDAASDPVMTGGSSHRRKQSLPKRRSARLASVNEDSSDEKTNKTASEKTTTNTPTSTSKSQGEATGSAKDSDSGCGTAAAPFGRRGRKMAIVLERTKFSPKTSGGGRKRLRVLESSSDEDSASTRRHGNSDDEKGYESETEQLVKEEDKEVEGEGRRRKRKRGRDRDKRSGQAESSLSQSSEPQSWSKRLVGQKRALEVREEVAGGNNKSRSSSPAQKKAKGKSSGKQMQEDRKLSPAFKQKSPSPVVVTRYNRRVKPNRRYTSPTRGSGSSSSHDESGQNIDS